MQRGLFAEMTSLFSFHFRTHKKSRWNNILPPFFFFPPSCQRQGKKTGYRPIRYRYPISTVLIALTHQNLIGAFGRQFFFFFFFFFFGLYIVYWFVFYLLYIQCYIWICLQKRYRKILNTQLYGVDFSVVVVFGGFYNRLCLSNDGKYKPPPRLQSRTHPSCK